MTGTLAAGLCKTNPVNPDNHVDPVKLAFAPEIKKSFYRIYMIRHDLHDVSDNDVAVLTRTFCAKLRGRDSSVQI
jgi:hypothetical protein